jgi:hypothetical protein
MQLIQAATCFLVERRDGRPPRLLGTCFAYRHSHILLTAAHCVKGLDAESLGFAIPTGEKNDEGLSIAEVHCHPEADIAVLRLPILRPLRILAYFWDYETAAGWGDEFVAIGYPADSSLEHGERPTPRMFRGFIQRYFHHQSYNGFKCLAAELSIGAPGGLSGGPVCWTRDQSKVIGVVAENLESSTFVEKVEEVREDGGVVRYETRNMINYALAVALHDVAEWLDEVIED